MNARAIAFTSVLAVSAGILPTLSSCMGARSPETTVAVTVAEPGPSPTPVVCTQDPPGLSLTAQALPDGTIAIIGYGFLPGEDTMLIATAVTRYANRARSSTLESHPAAEIGEDGAFQIEESLWLLDGETTWKIAVVHSRGVACTSITIR